MKFKIILTLFLPVLFFTGLSCNSPTEPKDNPAPDTTSHNFVWRVDTIGVYNSIVRDVTIINENDIWAVGEFFKKHSTLDSTSDDRYNAAHWDGMKWALKRVPIEINRGIGYGGILDTIYPQLYSVFALQSKVIFSTGGVTYLENGKFKLIRTPSFNEKPGENNFWGTKIWAKDDKNIWFVGYGGTIIYFNGSTFTKIPYSTEMRFLDIWGDESGLVRAIARNTDSYYSEVVRITGLTTERELIGLNQPIEGNTPDIFGSIWWRDTKMLFFLADNGIFQQENQTFKRLLNPYESGNRFYLHLIKGNANNDLFGVGTFSNIIHFNGKSFKRYDELHSSDALSDFYALSVKGNIVCAGGEVRGKGEWEMFSALLVIGKRY